MRFPHAVGDVRLMGGGMPELPNNDKGCKFDFKNWIKLINRVDTFMQRFSTVAGKLLTENVFNPPALFWITKEPRIATL